MATQRNWHSPAEFPLCPSQFGKKPLQDYLAKLAKGEIFSNTAFAKSIVEEACLGENDLSLSVICQLEDAVKPWAVTKVTVEAGRFCHENKGSFFSFDGANKRHFENLGKVWEGIIGDCIDDFC